MYAQIFKYIFKYKLKLSIAFLSMFFAVILSGASLSLIVPIVNKILAKDNLSTQSKIVFFDLSNKQKDITKTTILGNKKKINQLKYYFMAKINIFCANKGALELLKIFSLFLIVMICFKGLFYFLKEYFLENVSFHIIKDLRDDLYIHLHSLSMDYFTKSHVGEIMSRITNDTQLVHQAVARGWADIAFHFFNIAMYTFIAFYINWKLAIFALFFLPCLMFPIIKIGKKLRKISLGGQEKLADLTSILQETISGIKVVKAFAMQNYEIAKFTKQTHRYFKTMMKFVSRHAFISPLMEITGAIGGILLLVFGGKEVLEGRMSKGGFVLFIIAVLSLLHPFKKLSKSYGLIQQAFAGFDRIFSLFNIKSTIKEDIEPIELEGIKQEIKYENIAVSYDNKNIIVSDISFSIKPGQIIAFVGSSGSGKTSLLNLLPRFYNPYKGTILIDGVDIRKFSLESLRKNFGIVTQEVVLFNDTIFSNIAYGHKEFDFKKVIQAAKIANAHEFIEAFPMGYNTIVGDRGAKLSGGQRQRIAIARAVLKNPPILILDEATSALDTESEKYVQEALNRLMKGRTVFAIAHRLSTIKNANKIIVLDEKKAVQCGTHEQLLKQGGTYKKLYDMQIK